MLEDTNSLDGAQMELGSEPNFLCSFMPPTSKKLMRGILVSGCPCVRPFETIFEVYHILWTMHARILNFHIWIPHEQ